MDGGAVSGGWVAASGGGLWLDGKGDSLVCDVHFADNHAATAGGHLARADAALTLERCTPERGDAAEGGAIWAGGDPEDTLALLDSVLADNSAAWRP